VRDWAEFSRARLGARFAEKHPDAVKELGEHLTDLCERLEEQGIAPVDAEHRTLKQVSDWPRLRRQLEQAKEGDAMNNRHIRSVWLPGLLSAAIGFFLLRLTLAFGALPPWVAHRFLTFIGPVTRMDAGRFEFAIAWLFVLPLAGALGAFASWRAGGRPAHRLIAALFPSLTILGLGSVVLIGKVLLLTPQERPSLTALLPVMILWALFPAFSLAFGSLPFLPLNSRAPHRG
jgi:hypothetical protein